MWPFKSAKKQEPHTNSINKPLPIDKARTIAQESLKYDNDINELIHLMNILIKSEAQRGRFSYTKLFDKERITEECIEKICQAYRQMGYGVERLPPTTSLFNEVKFNWTI